MYSRPFKLTSIFSRLHRPRLNVWHRNVMIWMHCQVKDVVVKWWFHLESIQDFGQSNRGPVFKKKKITGLGSIMSCAYEFILQVISAYFHMSAINIDYQITLVYISVYHDFAIHWSPVSAYSIWPFINKLSPPYSDRNWPKFPNHLLARTFAITFLVALFWNVALFWILCIRTKC